MVEKYLQYFPMLSHSTSRLEATPQSPADSFAAGCFVHRIFLPFSMHLLHLRFCISVLLEQTSIAENHLLRRIMHLLPSVEASALAQSANFVWERMVKVMEKHFIPAMSPTQKNGHDASTESTIGANLSRA